jgi:cation:H+ antiporter
MTAVWHFILCAVVILVAATILTRCADAIAQTTKLGRLLVGSLFLAGATSLPELAIDINAVRMGLADVAVGDLVGSSLFNLLILAVFDLTHHSRRRMLSRMSSAHALSGAASIGLTALAGATIYIGGRRPDWALGGISVGSLVIFGAYLLSMRVIFYDQRVSRFVA